MFIYNNFAFIHLFLQFYFRIIVNYIVFLNHNYSNYLYHYFIMTNFKFIKNANRYQVNLALFFYYIININNFYY